METVLSKKTVAFVLSETRSGSTWIGYVLGSSTLSAFLGEYFRAWNKDLSVPCSLCSARGRSTCEVLLGIEEIPEELAFSWAFDRTGKQLLVDNSKVLDWVGRFLAPGCNYNIRLIHVIRDPRGWYSSEKRRTPGPYKDLIRRWYDTNIRIKEFAENSGHPYVTVFYDEIAARPTTEFEKIFRFCGVKFDLSCLEYWRFPHHGFAANGATSPVLADEQFKHLPPHFLTGDDAFYKLNSRKLFIDKRWQRDLDLHEQRVIANDSAVIDLLSMYNRTLTPEGIDQIRPISLVIKSVRVAEALVRKAFESLRNLSG